MTDHITKKRILMDMTKKELELKLSEIVLSEEERELMELLYIKRKPLTYIADIMGFSESGIKKMHCRIIKRMKNL